MNNLNNLELLRELGERVVATLDEARAVVDSQLQYEGFVLTIKHTRRVGGDIKQWFSTLLVEHNSHGHSQRQNSNNANACVAAGEQDVLLTAPYAAKMAQSGQCFFMTRNTTMHPLPTLLSTRKDAL